MPPYQTILDGQNMDIFWGYVKWILFLVAPLVMIWVAVEIVGRVSVMIKKTVQHEDRERYVPDDDDNYYR